jgi:hypothetical protein
MVASALSATIPFAARADEAAVQREAQARFEEGIARVKAENFEAARVSFTQAYAVLHKPTILWNLALAEEKSGHPLEALGHFKEFARAATVVEDRANAEKHIGGLMGQTGHVDVAAPAGTQVIVDGAIVGIAPLSEPLDVLPGRHHVEAHTPQGPREADVQVAVGQTIRVSTAPPSPDPVRSPEAPAPRAAAASVGDTSPVRITAKPIQLTGDTGRVQGHGSSNGAALTVGAVGAVALISVGLGVYFGLQSQNDKSTSDDFLRQHGSAYCFQMTTDNAATCAQWNDAKQAQDRAATWSNVFYIAGGALAAAGVAIWFLWPKESTSAVAGVPQVFRSSLRFVRACGLVPIVVPEGAGLGAGGTF